MTEASSSALALPSFARLLTRLVRFRPLGAALRLQLGMDVRVEGHVRLPGRGHVRIGDGVHLLGRRSPVELHAHRGAEIILESGATLEDGSSVEATGSVRIGSGARIGAFSKIMDNHFHRATGDRGQRPAAVPVVVGAGAIVGPRAVLLPGAAMGGGSMLGAGSVLSFWLPDGAVFPGSPRA